MKLDKTIFNLGLHGKTEEATKIVQQNLDKLNNAIARLVAASQVGLSVKTLASDVETELLDLLNAYGAVAAGKVLREYMLDKAYGAEVLARHEEKSTKEHEPLN